MAVLALGTSLLAAAPVAEAQSSSFSYAPGSHQYRVQSTTKVTQELNGQTTEGELNTRHVLTLGIGRKAKDTLSIAYTWDSASVSTTGGIPAPDLSKVGGTKAAGLSSATGRMYTFDPGKAVAEGVPNMEEFELFLPVIAAADKKVGETWVDTVTTSGNRGGVDVNTTVIVTSTFAGDTTLRGRKIVADSAQPRVHRLGCRGAAGDGTRRRRRGYRPAHRLRHVEGSVPRLLADAGLEEHDHAARERHDDSHDDVGDIAGRAGEG